MQRTFDLKKIHFPQSRIFWHILFWSLYVVFYSFLWGSNDDRYEKAVVSELLSLPVKMMVAYLTLYVFMPRFLFTKRYVSFFAWLISALAVAALIDRTIHYTWIIPTYYPEQASLPYFNGFRILKTMVYFNSVVFITGAIKLLKIWYKQQQAAQSLEKEKLEAELNFLKGQIHPHFLFNTLNNLYSLTLKKSDRAPEVVLKLSELMDYMLYNTSEATVPLDKEINYLSNYIMLEKIRYGDRLDTSFNVWGDISSHQITPLLLLPFVENSFKHGVSSEIEGVWVTIDLKVKDGILSMKVENSKSREPFFQVRSDHTAGIGLKNVKRRLELLYPGAYKLDIVDEETSYLVDLKLALDPTQTLPPDEAKSQTNQWSPPLNDNKKTIPGSVQ